jgi:hypothetical protein
MQDDDVVAVVTVVNKRNREQAKTKIVKTQ